MYAETILNIFLSKSLRLQYDIWNHVTVPTQENSTLHRIN